MEPAVCNPRVNVQNHDGNDMLSDDEKQAVGDIKGICLKTVELATKLHREIYALEEKAEPAHNLLYDERKKVLDGLRQKHKGDPLAKNMGNFWLHVLKAAVQQCPEFARTNPIGDTEAEVLCHISDIRSKLYTEPELKFDIIFYFEPNAYIKNDYLRKVYYIKCKADPKEPQAYDGAEIYRTEGTMIHWTSPALNAKYRKTFLKFFMPPTLPYSSDDPNYKEINEILENDFRFGFYLKENVIPKAVYFFTGEIKESMGSSSSTDDENDDDDDGGNDNEDESGSAGSNSLDRSWSDDEKNNDDEEEPEDVHVYGELLDSEDWSFESGDSMDSGH
ncbi:nucleosome assembly protein 1-like 1 [Drosophila miranda]|uniref:nucleosome assembly protein 1-like 1 n=1 Tax=Drosophila miranda TaxID=7229 RepID=UPI0007E877DB|nr:nucleosome assembly protein 1-like 1 [Drosophila miranda]